MPTYSTALRNRAELLARLPNANPIELAEALWEVRRHDPSDLKTMIEGKFLRRRRAYYLLQVWETFRRLKITKGRLSQIGWTKLQIIAQHSRLGQQTKARALTLAQQHSARDLAVILQSGELPSRRTHSTLFRLSTAQNAALRKALLVHGAKPARNGGLTNKEQALIRLIRTKPPGATKWQV